MDRQCPDCLLYWPKSDFRKGAGPKSRCKFCRTVAKINELKGVVERIDAKRAARESIYREGRERSHA
jgi:hypothetical protein